MLKIKLWISSFEQSTRLATGLLFYYGLSGNSGLLLGWEADLKTENEVNNKKPNRTGNAP